MNRFTKPLLLRAVRQTYRGLASILPSGFHTPTWEIVEAFSFYYDLGARRIDITVPSGFRFDGTSVPLFLRSFFPRAHPDYMQAAALHDYLYSHQGNIDPSRPWLESDEHQFLSRRDVDRIFYDSLIILGMAKIWAYPMYLAVRLGGGRHWNKRKCD